jgi:type II secretory pathway pseudopilin PulG
MSVKVKSRRRSLRGWLMIEVAVGGVMASVILGSLLIQVGDSMDKTVVVGRELTATMLAQQAIEQARGIAAPFVNLTDGTTTVAVPSGMTGTYTRTRTVASGHVTIAGQALSFKDVKVTVTFPTNDGLTKTVLLETRLYADGTL